MEENGERKRMKKWKDKNSTGLDVPNKHSQSCKSSDALCSPYRKCNMDWMTFLD